MLSLLGLVHYLLLLSLVFTTCVQKALCAKSLQSCPTLCDPMDCSPARLLCPWDSPGQNTGVGWHALLQGIFLTQGSNLRLLHLPALAGGSFIPGKPMKSLGPRTSLNLMNVRRLGSGAAQTQMTPGRPSHLQRPVSICPDPNKLPARLPCC